MIGASAQGSKVDDVHPYPVVRWLLLLLVLICIFDPADVMLGAKIPAFAGLWLVTLGLGFRDDRASLPKWLLGYVLAFMAIPLLSILWFYYADGRQPFEGFQLLKGYLFVSLAFILVLNRIDLVPMLSAVLSVVAVLTVVLFIYLQLEPEQFLSLRDIGVATGTLTLDRRAYGSNLEVLQVYFVTSTLLVVPIAYYFDRALTVPPGRKQFFYWGLAVLNTAGLFLGGVRNNIIISLLLPFFLLPLYTKRVMASAVFSLLALVLVGSLFWRQLEVFFDVKEVGNSIRLGYLPDYIALFGDPHTLLFGEGLGAYHFWSVRGYSFYVTELTFLEMIRNFGLIGFTLMMSLLLFPVVRAFTASAFRRQRALALAYFLYLLTCVTSPNLFSSTGILLLTVVVADIALGREGNAEVRS